MRVCRLPLWTSFGVVAALSGLGHAAEEAMAPVPVVPPQEALATFSVAPGYRMELVASEPLVHEPVQIAFDPSGRLWVVEMSGFMRDMDGTSEGQPTGSIRILEDRDGDGVMDRATVFLDHLVMPRAIALVAGGAIIAEPPHLWLCQDTNGDLVSDAKTALVTDYGQPGNPEHTANGLLWAIDNWIYSANHGMRYRFTDGRWTSEKTASRGQWGITQDDVGTLFYNSNSDPLRGDLLPSALAQRNPAMGSLMGMLNVSLEKDLAVWPSKATPGVNRGYRPGTLRKAGSPGVPGSLAKFTASCGPCVYRGDLMPELTGNVFVAEPAANLVRREVLSRQDFSLRAANPYQNQEFINSTDERFRPVNFANGPDGALYVVDMYKGLLQHRIFMTKEYLRPYLERRGLDKPASGLGRIYRVVPEQHRHRAQAPLALDQASAQELIVLLGHPGGWWRDMAQQILVQRQDLQVIPALRQTAKSDIRPLARLHALWTLEGLGDRDPVTLVMALREWDARVRGAALRLCEPLLGASDSRELRAQAMLLVDDPDASVRLVAAAVLGRAEDPAADTALVRLLQREGDAAVLRDAAISGLRGRELKFLDLLSRQAPAAGDGALIAALVRVAAKDAAAPAGLEAVAVRMASHPERAAALTEALAAAKIAVPKVASPMESAEAPPAPVLDEAAQRQIRAGAQRYLQMCAGCHQPTGEGLPGLAPPLAKSAWVTGPPARTIRIILHGVEGPITAAGTSFNGEMPPMGGGLDDAAVADVVTFLRNAWGHQGSAVPAKTVAEIRAQDGSRPAWTAKELESAP